ncbi:MAG: hypothetical protein KBS59_00845, partial [Clostridiales bacterium]|nr:hypothetical protein [Clostridiales bacterium]
MAKKFWIIFALCAVIVATALLTSCDAVVPLITYVELDGDEVYECEVGDFKIENLVLNAYYNTGDVEKINVTRDMIPASEYLKLFKTGEQTIRIDYNGLSASFRINILRHSFKNEIFLEDKVFVYDGYPHSLEITGSMPEGTSVRFPTGNAFTDAGEYQVRAVIEKDGYESFELVSTLTILKADYDTSGLLFEDKKVLYSGTTQTIEISSKLPRDLHVEYEAFLEDGKTPAPRVTSEGIYIIAAHLTTDNPNYNPIPDLLATLEIQKDTYNMANIRLADVTVQYDGKSHRPEIINENKIPQDIKYSISYTTSGGKKMASAPVDAGEYTATLTFIGNDNYNDIPPVTSKVIIEKIVIDTSMLRLYSEAFKYDGQPHSLIVQGDIPKGVSVKYEGNEQIYAGKYSVTAHITCAESKNYRPTSETLTAEIVIDPIESEMPVESYNIAFDGTAVSFVGVDESITADIKLFDSEDKEVTKPQYGVIYKFTADCRYKDENRARSETLKSDAGNVMFLDPEKIYYPSGSVLYSGEDFAALMFGAKSENVPLSYVGKYSYEVYKVDGEKRTKVSEARDVGRYVIKMSLSNSVGFGVIAPKEVELIISTISVELPSYTDLTVTYSGNENKLLWTGLPAGMEVEFYEIKVGTADPVKFAANDENLWKTTINPGVYTVTAYIKNHENFGCAESATATLTVNRMSQPTFTNKTVTYSGNPNDMSLPGIPAEDIEYYKINGTQHSPTDANLWNNTINADTYSVTVKLKEQGHYENEETELTAILTVNKINAGSVPESYNDLHAMVDGKTHPHLPTGLPACAIITEYQINGGTKYAVSNNSGWGVTKEAGNYSVTVY